MIVAKDRAARQVRPVSGHLRKREAEAQSFTLRAYQADIVGEACSEVRAGHDVLMESPTGSGKTWMMRILARLLMGGRSPATHCVIACPQEDIEQGFLGDEDVRAEWPGGSRRPLVLRPSDVRRVRGSGKSASRALFAYLKDPNPGYGVVCTHQVLNYLMGSFATLLPADFSGRLLMLDEAHHAPAPVLSKSVDAWSRRGGRLVYASASPYRSDGQLVVRPGMVVIRRSMAEHMDGGLYAPSRIEHGIVAVGSAGDRVSGAEFEGRAISADGGLQETFVREMVRKWVDLGRPKTIAGAPILRGGSSAFVEALLAGFARAGARVLDATGQDEAKKQAILAAIKADRDRSVADSRFDVVIGIQRVKEGFDWPHASTVFTVGIPGSISDVTQSVGRATRLKPADYPEAFRDVAGIYFFVPTAGGSALDELSVEHSRHAMLTMAFLADFAAAEQWIVAKAVAAGASRVSRTPRIKGKTRFDHGLSMEDYALVRIAMAAATEGPGAVTAGRLIEAAVKACPAVPAEAIKVIAVGLLATDKEMGPGVVASIEDEAERLAKVGPDIRPEMAAAFDAIVGKYRDQDLGDPAGLAGLREQAHGLTGRGAREWMGRFAREGYGTPWSDSFIREKAEDYRSKHGRYPNQRSGVIDEVNVTWGAAHCWLRENRGVGLTEFLECRPRYIEWSRELIREKAEAFRKLHGYWPVVTSGTIDGMDALWLTPDNWLRRKYGIGLTRFLMDGGVPGAFSDELILEKAEEFRRARGKWPTTISGKIDGMDAHWYSVNRWLYREYGFGLKRFLTGHARGAWSLDFIRKKANEYRLKNSKWPSAASGAIDELCVEWSAADQWLRKYHRTSLSRMLKAHAECDVFAAGPDGRPEFLTRYRSPEAVPVGEIRAD
jgi:hypothetical protein